MVEITKEILKSGDVPQSVFINVSEKVEGRIWLNTYTGNMVRDEFWSKETMKIVAPSQRQWSEILMVMEKYRKQD